MRKTTCISPDILVNILTATNFISYLLFHFFDNSIILRNSGGKKCL